MAQTHKHTINKFTGFTHNILPSICCLIQYTSCYYTRILIGLFIIELLSQDEKEKYFFLSSTKVF